MKAEQQEATLLQGQQRTEHSGAQSLTAARMERAGRMLVLALFLCLAGWIYWRPSSRTDLENQTVYYSLLATAFLQGHTYVPVEMPPKVIEDFENKRYDAVFANPDRAKILWDSSIYKGHTYLYWGPVPAVLCVAWAGVGPIRHCTDPILSLVAALGVVICFYLIFDQLGKIYDSEGYKDILWFMLAVFAFGSLQMHMMGGTYQGVYYATIIFGVFFLLMGLFFFLRYVLRRNISSLILMNIFFSLAIGTRIIVAIYIFCVLIAVLIAEKKSFAERNYHRLTRLVLSLAPLAFTSIALLLYNYYRFDNLLEFGMKYGFTDPQTRSYYDELGIYNVKYIARNLYDYIFRIPDLSLFQPFIKLDIDYNQNRYWTTSAFFLAPIMVAAFAALPFWNKIVRKEVRLFLAPIIVGTLLSIGHYSLWFGTVLRYAYEFGLGFYIVAYVVLLYVHRIVRQRIRVRRLFIASLAAAGAWSLFAGWVMLLFFFWEKQ